MNDDRLNHISIDEPFIRAEKAKARKLRKSRWWQQKTSSGTCYYCNENVGINNLTMDHVVPLSKGGRSSKDNLVPCCKKCNNRKKTSLPIEWQEYMDTLTATKPKGNNP